MNRILFTLLTISILSFGINSCSNNSTGNLSLCDCVDFVDNWEGESYESGIDIYCVDLVVASSAQAKAACNGNQTFDDTESTYEEPEEVFNEWCDWCNNGIRGGGVIATIERNYKISNVKCCSHKCKTDIERKYPYVKRQMNNF